MITVWEWSEFSRVFVGIGWFLLIVATLAAFIPARFSLAGIFRS